MNRFFLCHNRDARKRGQFLGKKLIRWTYVAGGCGSCFAFASAGMQECRLKVMSRNRVSIQLSPQDVVECSHYAQGEWPSIGVTSRWRHSNRTSTWTRNPAVQFLMYSLVKYIQFNHPLMRDPSIICVILGYRVKRISLSWISAITDVYNGYRL